jgi:cholesterol oxidase
MFRLTIGTADLYRFMKDPHHFANASGWIKSDVLGGRRLPVECGTFNLFVDEGPASKQMLYRLFFSDGVGRPLTLAGFKDIYANRLTAVWPETTTLYTRILNGHVEAADENPDALVGCGILRILPTDFAWQLTTFRAWGPDLRARLEGLAAFGKFFGSELWEVYGPRVRRPGRA